MDAETIARISADYGVMRAWKAEPHLVNPLLANKAQRKADKLDARQLATQAMLGMWPRSVICTPDQETARLAFAHRKRLLRERTRLTHDSLLTEFACDTEGAESWVYIIEAVGVDRVKIGVAIDPERRLQQLQTGSPVPLRLLSRIRGGRAVERGLHARFSAFRLAGEWFHLIKWVRRMIEGLCSGDGADNAEMSGQLARSVDRTSQGGGDATREQPFFLGRHPKA